MTLDERIDATLAAVGAGLVIRLDALLSDGYARAHTIEREILGLVRHRDSLLDDEGSSAELRQTLRRRAVLREELTTLRVRLDTVRALAETSPQGRTASY